MFADRFHGGAEFGCGIGKFITKVTYMCFNPMKGDCVVSGEEVEMECCGKCKRGSRFTGKK